MRFTFVVVAAIAGTGPISAQQRIECLEHRHPRIVFESTEIDQIVSAAQFGGIALWSKDDIPIATAAVVSAAATCHVMIAVGRPVIGGIGTKGVSRKWVGVGWTRNSGRKWLLGLGGRSGVEC